MGHSTTVLGLKPVGSTVRYSSYSLRRVPSSTLRPISACVYPTYSSVLGRGRVRRSTFFETSTSPYSVRTRRTRAGAQRAHMNSSYFQRNKSHFLGRHHESARSRLSDCARVSCCYPNRAKPESRSAELIERERHRALRRPHPHPTRSDTSLPRPKARLLLSAEAATRRCFGRSTTTEESSTYGPQGINSNGRLPAPQSGKPQATTNERGCRAHAMRVAHARGCDSATFVVRASHARACTHSKGKGLLCAS